MMELCEHYGISRKARCERIGRFVDEGRPGLLGGSRTPLSCPHETPEHVVEALIEAREHHPYRGPKDPSRRSLWWLNLGIYPELIEPGRPEQNGRHERVHRTLKAETTRPPAANRRSRQRRFSSFRRT